MSKYCLTIDTHPRIEGKLLAIISIGSPQLGDKEVTVCSIEVVNSKEEAKLWYHGQMVSKPWENRQ